MQKENPWVSAFARLGEFIGQFHTGIRRDTPWLNALNEEFHEKFLQVVRTEHVNNPWFTEAYILKALEGITRMLEREILEEWLEPYGLPDEGSGDPKTIGLVLAGNIPLVGFHDLMCVLISGHRVRAKPSSKDDRLIRILSEVLIRIEPEFSNRIRISEEYIKEVDAVIATGSDNSARYFEYYFREIPHIIRKNRNGIAVLTGQETDEELAGLGEDIFTYFGMGCRNVTKLYIPESYDLTAFMAIMDRYSDLYQHHKYGNNVDYHRAVYLMNQVAILDNGVLILKEDDSIASPVGVVFYERYSEIEKVQQLIDTRREEIQCIVSLHPGIREAILPGETQVPGPWDYADGIDTLSFLKSV